MWIFIRDSRVQTDVKIDNLSKLTKVEDLRLRILEKISSAKPVLQRLLYRGKQLEDGHTLFDYDISLNTVIQLMLRTEESILQKKSIGDGVSKESSISKSEPVVAEPEVCVDKSLYYRLNDNVDTCAGSDGCYYEAVITKIVVKTENSEFLFDDNGNPLKDSKDGFMYFVKYLGDHPENNPMECFFGEMRPRSWKKIKFDDLLLGETVLANYNNKDTKGVGHWYDSTITSKTSNRIKKELKATILLHDKVPLPDCTIIRVDEFFRIEKPVKLTERDEETEHYLTLKKPQKRDTMPECSHCNDVWTRRCKKCACQTCGGKDKPGEQILCDECGAAFHLTCFDPPLKSVPDSDWYCSDCQLDTSEVVGAGEKLKASRKKSKMPSMLTTSTRDWGKGMACAGRQKSCTIVPADHFGPIPGIEVGYSCIYRLQLGEIGVHRPVVAGISGREKVGSFSIVLSGGYDDDNDSGDEFTYTGSGGRDLSGNKRTAKQSSDQLLTNMNRALAVNCDCPVSEKGGVAKNWKAGKPVRVTRSYKGRKTSKFAPEEGLRYDGIYKVVKYWPQAGVSGFTVWRYEFRRDDPTPAPWTKQGKKRIEQLGLKMNYPEHYLEEKAAKENQKMTTKGKRKPENTADEIDSKKAKTVFKLNSDQIKVVRADGLNQKLWKECELVVGEGYEVFIEKVKESFTCVCCQDLARQPVTTPCGHNSCKECLARSLQSDQRSCPVCRFAFTAEYKMVVNTKLERALTKLMVG